MDTKPSALGIVQTPEQKRRYREKNKVRLKEWFRKHYQKNRDKIIKRTKAYWKRNPDKQKASLKRFREKDPEAYKKYQREWAKAYRLKNLEKCRAMKVASEAKRRALQKSAPIRCEGIRRWMVEVRKLPFVRCHWCGTKIRGKMIHFDHVIPLKQGGQHSISNLCCACAECNLNRGAKMPHNWQRNGQSFLSL